MASAYQPVRISTHAVEYAIGQMADISDAVGFCYQNEGHFFYYLNFPSGNRTFCYDMTTGLWHERAFFVESTGLNKGHNLISHAYFNGKNLVGNFSNGDIFELSMEIYTEDDKPIKRIFTFPHIAKENKRVTFNNLEIDMEKGVGKYGILSKNVTIDFIGIQINNTTNCQLTDISTGFVSGRFWDFADGTTQTGTINPTHHFPQYGHYPISETLTYDGAKDGYSGSGTVTNTINIEPAGEFEIQDTIADEESWQDTIDDLTIIQKIN
jgi:PKD repeat protein